MITASDDRLLQIRRHSQQIAAVRQQSHDERADQRADHAAFAAVQAAAADHHRRDRLQLVALAGGRLPGHQPRRFDHSRQPRQHAADRRRPPSCETPPESPHRPPRPDCCRSRTRSGPAAYAPAITCVSTAQTTSSHSTNGTPSSVPSPRNEKLRRNLMHRQAVRNDQRHAAENAQRAQRHDERRDSQARRQHAVEQAADESRQNADQHAHRRSARPSPSPSCPAVRPSPESRPPKDRCRRR